MIRSSRHILKYQNQGKTDWLDKLFEDYLKELRYYINSIQTVKLPLDKNLSSKQLEGKHIFHSQWKQNIYKQASEIIRSCRKKHKKVKKIQNISIILDERLFDVEYQEIGEFDEFIRIKLPYFEKSKKRAITINVPIKHHKHSLKYSSWNRKKSVRLKKIDGKYFLDIIYEKQAPDKKLEGNSIGIDQGYNKLYITSENQQSKTDFKLLYLDISKKKQGSKNFKQILIERDKLINQEVNQLIKENDIKTIVIEDLKNVKKKSKFSKSLNNKMQRWSYNKFTRKLQSICEEQGIDLKKVSPAYTSQRCSKCGEIYEESRNGEKFICISCGYSEDADLNAAKNILHRGVYNPSITRNQKQ